MLAVAPFIYMLMTSFKSYGSVINNMLWPWPPFGSEALQLAELPAGDSDGRLGLPVGHLAVLCATWRTA